MKVLEVSAAVLEPGTTLLKLSQTACLICLIVLCFPTVQMLRRPSTRQVGRRLLRLEKHPERATSSMPVLGCHGRNSGHASQPLLWQGRKLSPSEEADSPFRRGWYSDSSEHVGLQCSLRVCRFYPALLFYLTNSHLGSMAGVRVQAWFLSPA